MALQIVMTLAGTFPVLGYLFIQALYGKNIKARYYIFLLRLGIIFYLVPFQYYKFLFPAAGFKKFDAALFWDMLQKRLFGYSFISISAGTGSYFILSRTFFFLCLLWFFVAVIQFLYRYRNYPSVKKTLEVSSEKKQPEDYFDPEEQRQLARSFKRHFNYDKIRIYETDLVPCPCTLGVFSPCIFLPANRYSRQELHWIFRHELTHILHSDTLWKSLAMLCCVIHWYNPFAYVLLMQYALMSEYYCDEDCFKDCSREEKKAFCTFLVKECAGDTALKWPLMQFLSGGGKKLKRRIDRLLNKEKESTAGRRGILFAGLFTACLAVFTIYGYDAVPQVTRPLRGNEYVMNACESLADDRLRDVRGSYAEFAPFFAEEFGRKSFIADTKNMESREKGLRNVRREKNLEKTHKSLSAGGCLVKTYWITTCRLNGDETETVLVTKRKYHSCLHQSSSRGRKT